MIEPNLAGATAIAQHWYELLSAAECATALRSRRHGGERLGSAKPGGVRTGVHSAVALSLLAVAAAGAALYVSLSADRRAQAADERAVAAEERAAAELVILHVEALTEPSISKEILEWGLTISNFGPLPIGDVEVRADSHLGGPGEAIDAPVALVTEVGVIRQCSEVQAVFESPLGDDPRIVFTDVNGRRWSRKPGEPPVRAAEPAHMEVNSSVRWESSRIDECAAGR